MVPTPTPAPPMPMQAMPAPIIFAACGSIRKLLFEVDERASSVARVNGIVEIDAGEDGEDVGLQEGYQQLERGERDGEAEREDGAEPSEKAECSQHDDEPAEHLERDVAGEHVGEQPHAVGNGTRQERQNLDEYHQRQDVDRDSARHEQLEKAQPVSPEAVDHNRQEHEQREGDGDDDVA